MTNVSNDGTSSVEPTNRDQLFRHCTLFGYRKEGECLFPGPFIGAIVDASYWNSKLPPLSQRLRSTTDDRAFVILSAIVVEHLVDETLSVWMPGYNVLNKHQDFNFSLKLDLLGSLRLIPRYLITSSHCIRKIRNDFAHEIDVDTLGQLKLARVQLRGMVCELTPKEAADGCDPRTLIEFLVFIVSVGLVAYRQNMRQLRADIETDEYMAGLSERVKEKFRDNADRL